MTSDDAVAIIERLGGALEFTYATGTRVYRFARPVDAQNAQATLAEQGVVVTRSTRQLYLKAQVPLKLGP